MSVTREFREKCGLPFLHISFELIMPLFMSIAAKKETMYSSKVFSDASFVCARIALETLPSEVAMVMVILYTESENEMSSLAGTPYISRDFSTFLTCSLCNISTFFPSNLVFATRIHVSLFFKSFPLVSSVASGLKN